MRRFLIAGALSLAGSAIYLFAFPSATLVYEGVVLFHIFLGAVFLVLGVPWMGRLMRGRGLWEKLGWAVVLLGGVLGAIIIFTGARRPMWPVLYTHEVVSVVGCAVLLFVWAGRPARLRRLQGTPLRTSARLACCLVVAAGVAGGAWWVRTVPWQRAYVIHNPSIAPASMDTEGAGTKSEFFPSSAETSTGKTVPEDYFVDSAACKECHADIYREWESSAHHFSSFNNQWYRQAIVYMQDVDGVQARNGVRAATTPRCSSPATSTRPSRTGSSRRRRRPVSAAWCATPSATCAAPWATARTHRISGALQAGGYNNPYLRKLIDFLIEEIPSRTGAPS